MSIQLISNFFTHFNITERETQVGSFQSGQEVIEKKSMDVRRERIKKNTIFLKKSLLKSPRDKNFSITFQYLARFTTTNNREGETNLGFIEMR